MRKLFFLTLLALASASLSGCISGGGEDLIYFDQNVLNYYYDSNSTDLNWEKLSGVMPWADVNVADDITLTDITQITNRDYSDLQGLPVIPSDSNAETACSPGSLLLGDGSCAVLPVDTNCGVSGSCPAIVYDGDNVTDTTSYWLCTAADCSTSCQVQIKDGLITGCT